MTIVQVLTNPILWILIAIIYALVTLYLVNLEESTTSGSKTCKNDEIICGTDCFVDSSGTCMKNSDNKEIFCNNYNIL